MLQLNTTSLNLLDNTFYGFDIAQINEFGLYANQLFQKNKVWQQQGFCDIIFDPSIVKDIEDRTQKFQEYIADIVILGIGGSMLGVQAIMDALYHTKEIQKFKIHYVDNIDPVLINNISKKLNLEKTLFLVQTKSGGTPETLAQYFYFENLIMNANFELQDHFVFITDPEIGYLRELANNNDGIVTFPVPENVGGRFSVLTSIGLVISVIVGLDAQQMLNGAKQVLENQKSDACKLAMIQTKLLSEGINQCVFMPYCSQLATIAKWYIQLLSESIGKEVNLDNLVVNSGITPIPSVGATDQHSQMQLFKEGPNDKLIIFTEVLEPSTDLTITQKNIPGFEYLRNVTFGELIKAELKATTLSLVESERPNLTIEIDKINEKSLGELFMLLQLSVAYIGEILEINTFDQPGVERSKVLTREILSGK